MAEDKPKIKLQFAPEQKSPTMKIRNGDYQRDFDAADQPFECEADEADMLLRMRHFVKVPEAEQTADSKQQTAEDAKSKVQSPKPKVTGKLGGAPAAAITSDTTASSDSPETK